MQISVEHDQESTDFSVAFENQAQPLTNSQVFDLLREYGRVHNYPSISVPIPENPQDSPIEIQAGEIHWWRFILLSGSDAQRRIVHTYLFEQERLLRRE